MRIVLLLLGFGMLLMQSFIWPADGGYEFALFFTGVIVLGIPHGAADLLVAKQNAHCEKKLFFKSVFFINYLGRLLLFALLIWLLPKVGILLFVVLASYHFGETDLYSFSTDTVKGKLFVFSYGWTILSVMLLHNYDEVMELLRLYDNTMYSSDFFRWVGTVRYQLLSFSVFFFFISTFLFFNGTGHQQDLKGYFLLQLVAIVVILFYLPLLQGFTFYFVIWHSLLSLRNIVRYLRLSARYKYIQITRQIVLYSILAIIGMVLFGIAGYLWSSTNALVIGLLTGLAVLTAPHMQIMQDMYRNIRARYK
jgi:beta-carotene 15,15'-dioxygenase